MANSDDLGVLPLEVATVASVDVNGEVSWPLDDAAAAVGGLADAGRVVLGLDRRTYDDKGRFVDADWSNYQPDGDNDVERARRPAMVALARVQTCLATRF